jgi:hypothetical protein
MTPTLGHQFECISSMALLLIRRSFTSNMKAPTVLAFPRMGPPKPTIGTPRSSTSQGPKTRQKPSSSFTSFRRFSKAPRSWPVNYSRARRYIHNRSNYLTYLPAFLPTYQRPNEDEIHPDHKQDQYRLARSAEDEPKTNRRVINRPKTNRDRTVNERLKVGHRSPRTERKGTTNPPCRGSSILYSSLNFPVS